MYRYATMASYADTDDESSQSRSPPSIRTIRSCMIPSLHSSPVVECASSPVRGAIKSLRACSFEYTAMPTDIHSWRNRHRDVPCVFRSSTEYIFTDTQKGEIRQMFHAGWKTDAGHPFLSCEGNLAVTSRGSGVATTSLYTPAHSVYPVSSTTHSHTQRVRS
jgi:hypothetical protein